MSKDWPDNRHKPTVSHSSISTFKSCDRAFALQYHNAVIADIDTRFEHKREATLQPLNFLRGSIFHETIQTALMRYRNYGHFPPDLMAIAREILREYIRFSKEWVEDVKKYPILGGMHKYWPNHEFAQPIENFYYDGDFPSGYRNATRQHLELWFERFNALLPDMPFMAIEPKNWLFPKEVSGKVPWFVHDDKFAVYANFDFLTKQNGEIAIYDWKTGKRAFGQESVADQLMTYAAFAIDKWKVDHEKIKLYAVWVDSGSIQEVDCDPSEIERIVEIWKKYQSDWAQRLTQVNGNGDRLFEMFPMTNDPRTCAFCKFRTCPGRRRTPLDPALLARDDDYLNE
jgi:hypothetical protein